MRIKSGDSEKMKAISLALGLFFLVHASCMAEESSSVFTEQDIPNIIAYHNTFGGPKFASKYGSAMFSGSGVFAGSKFDNIPFVGDRYFVAVITALGSVGCFEVSAPDPSIIVGDSVQIVSTRPTIMYVSDLMLNGAQAGTIVLGANCVIKSNSGSIMPPSDNNSGNSGKSGSTWQAARKDGLAARDAYEAWLAGLVGDTRAGADYWAAHRSLSRPGTCQSTDADVNNVSFRSGCENAKRILAPSDVRRKSEPAFRLGWNSFTPDHSIVSSSTTNEFCGRLASLADSIVLDRNKGEPYGIAIANVVDAMDSYDRASGGLSDTFTQTLVATDMVQRVYRSPQPSAEQAAAEIRARCMAHQTD